MRGWPILLLAALLFAGAGLIRAPGRGTPLATARALVRPLALPFLWQGVVDAQQHGSLGESVARGRLLLRLIPGWIDGHVYFASRLVFDGRDPGADPSRSYDQLFAALAWLEETRAAVPDRQDEILAAMASLLEIRGGEPSVGEVIRRRQGSDAVELADRLLAQAEVVAPSASLRERRLFLAPSLLASALRTGDDTRFAALLELTLQQAGTVRDRDLAARFTGDLEALRAYWNGEGELEDLRQRPMLAGLVPLLADRKL